MRVVYHSRSALRAVLVVVVLVACVSGQDMHPSGVAGLDLFYETSPSETMSQLFASSLALPLGPSVVPIGESIASVPSRWLHRRRTLGALEAEIAYIDAGLAMTPMGSGVGMGALHLAKFNLRSQ